MSLIKTDNEIQCARESGALLSQALQSVVDAVRPGILISELDIIASNVIESGGGKPSFLGFSSGDSIPFPATLCVSRNEEVVHGIGTRSDKLNEGDIVGLDIGCVYKKMFTDMAVTVPVGGISKERMNLLRVTRHAMYEGANAVKEGGFISDIGNAIEDSVDTKKYGIIRSLVGHGVGHSVHEPPQIPNFRSKSFPVVRLQKNMCLAIEPMITLGDYQVETAKDGWTIITKDGSDAAHFEVTVVVTEGGSEIITPLPTIKI